MGYHCCAYNCKEKQVDGSVYSFHAFPEDPILRKKWIRSIRRKDFIPTDETRICSKHFQQDAFSLGIDNKSLLKTDAIPTLFDFTGKPHRVKRKNPETYETANKRLIIESSWDIISNKQNDTDGEPVVYSIIDDPTSIIGSSPHIIICKKNNIFKPVAISATTHRSAVVESSSSGIIAADIKRKCVSPVSSPMVVDCSSLSQSSSGVIAADMRRECVSPVSSPMVVDSSSVSGSSSHVVASDLMKDTSDPNVSSMSIMESQPSSVPASSSSSISVSELKKPETSVHQVSSSTSASQPSQSRMHSDVESDCDVNSTHSMTLRKRPATENFNITDVDLSEFWEKLYHLAKRTVIKQRKRIRRLSTYRRALEAKVKRLATLVDVLIQREICDR